MDAFLTALKISVTDKMLPMESKTLQEKHMELCTPEGIVLDFKNTSWTKISTFLRRQDKAKIIKYKKPKNQKKGTPP